MEPTAGQRVSRRLFLRNSVATNPGVKYRLTGFPPNPDFHAHSVLRHNPPPDSRWLSGGFRSRLQRDSRLALSGGPEPVEGLESKPLDELGTLALVATGGAVSMSNGPEGALFTLREYCGLSELPGLANDHEGRHATTPTRLDGCSAARLGWMVPADGSRPRRDRADQRPGIRKSSGGGI
jgi:hypothetical protein